jgi:pimeloyl-ACP methyl ester carboxylesterase
MLPDSFAPPERTAVDLAARHGWQIRRFRVGDFVLVGYGAPGRLRGDVLRVYVEGDGAGWSNRFTPPADPTPRDPVAFRLAVADGAPGTLYLARACQYRALGAAGPCTAAYWAEARFAPVLLAAYDAAITEAMRVAGARRVELAGYSGGGVVVALLAARRADVAGLVTVAAPLDTAAWTRAHDVAPLSGSLSPMDVAARLGAVPQVHLAGDRDDTVPVATVRTLMDALGATAPARLVVMAGFDHRCCWVARWPKILGTAGWTSPSGPIR